MKKMALILSIVLAIIFSANAESEVNGMSEVTRRLATKESIDAMTSALGTNATAVKNAIDAQKTAVKEAIDAQKAAIKGAIDALPNATQAAADAAYEAAENANNAAETIQKIVVDYDDDILSSAEHKKLWEPNYNEVN